jgi:nucleoside-diphosphate-sugar epimerase
MRVVVTGGAGFIGSNLCARLLATDDVLARGSSYGLRGSVD